MVTAEIAIAIPALLLVVGLVMGAIHWVMEAVSATSVAAETARAIAQGEPEGERLMASKRSVPLADWAARHEALDICVDARLPPPILFMGHVTVTQCVPR